MWTRKHVRVRGSKLSLRKQIANAYFYNSFIAFVVPYSTARIVLLVWLLGSACPATWTGTCFNSSLFYTTMTSTTWFKLTIVVGSRASRHICFSRQKIEIDQANLKKRTLTEISKRFPRETVNGPTKILDRIAFDQNHAIYSFRNIKTVSLKIIRINKQTNKHSNEDYFRGQGQIFAQFNGRKYNLKCDSKPW